MYDENLQSTKANCNGDYINVNHANGLCKRALAEVDEVMHTYNLSPCRLSLMAFSV